MSTNCNELVQLAEALTIETNTEKLLRISEQLLHVLDKVEAEQHDPAPAAD